MTKNKKALLLATALLSVSASQAIAQGSNTGDTVDVTTSDTIDVTTDDMSGVTTESREGDDESGNWGLFGLLGLAGLLGLKRRGPDNDRDTTIGTTDTRR